MMKFPFFLITIFALAGCGTSTNQYQNGNSNSATMTQCSNAPVFVQHRANRAVDVTTQDGQCVISIDGATKSDDAFDCEGAILYAKPNVEVDRIIGQGSCTYMVN